MEITHLRVIDNVSSAINLIIMEIIRNVNCHPFLKILYKTKRVFYKVFLP